MRVLAIVAVCTLGLAPVCSGAASGEEFQQVPLRVTFNAVDEGDVLVYMGVQQEIWFPLQSLRSFGFISEVEPREIEGESHVLLGALAPDLSYTLDLRRLELKITTGTDQLEKGVYDFQRTGVVETQISETSSAFLNYSISHTSGDEQETLSVLAPYELAVSFGKPLFYSSFQYTRDLEGKRNQRLLTNLSWDEPDWLTRLTIGDVLANSSDLGSRALIGGIGFATETGLDPYWVRYPGLNISGDTATPSKVQVQINDLTVFSEDVPPGPFEFRNLPYALGAGTARIVIKDAFGRETIVEVPYYNSSSILKSGVHEFGYFAGRLRLDIADPAATEEYGDPAYFAFHRYGLLDWLNFTLRAEGSEQLVNTGGGIRLLVGLLGEVTAVYSASSFDDQDGESTAYSYDYSSNWFSLGLTAQRASELYATVDTLPTDDKNRLSWSAAVGISIGSLGSLSMTQSHDEPYVAPPHTTTTLSYLRQLIGSSMLLLRGTKFVEEIEPEPRSELTVSASLLMFFGEGRTASVSHSKSDDGRQSRIGYNKDIGVGTGAGYGIQLTRDSEIEADDGYGGQANLQYNFRWAQTRIDHRKLAGLNNTTLNLAGSFAWVDGGLYPARPITDSFALVRLPHIEDVRVQAGYQEVGETNAEGELLVSNLSAYSDNTIAIDQRDIPFEYEVRKLKKNVRPWHRGGALVVFPVRLVQAFTGNLFIIIGGERKSADLAGLEIALADRKEKVIVGNNGEFYLENLPPGRYQARIFRDDLSCTFTLEIPDSDETIIDLGEQTCKLD